MTSSEKPMPNTSMARAPRHVELPPRLAIPTDASLMRRADHATLLVPVAICS
jgi:hypothetical protein